MATQAGEIPAAVPHSPLRRATSLISVRSGAAVPGYAAVSFQFLSPAFAPMPPQGPATAEPPPSRDMALPAPTSRRAGTAAGQTTCSAPSQGKSVLGKYIEDDHGPIQYLAVQFLSGFASERKPSSQTMPSASGPLSVPDPSSLPCPRRWPDGVDIAGLPSHPLAAVSNEPSQFRQDSSTAGRSRECLYQPAPASLRVSGYEGLGEWAVLSLWYLCIVPQAGLKNTEFRGYNFIGG